MKTHKSNLLDSHTPESYLMGTYRPLPIHFTEGDGCWLVAASGDKYFDAISGVGVTNIGHSPAELTGALSSQARKLWHVSNLVTIEEQVRLGERICKLSNMEKAFFCNSGAEANETALKLARLHGHRKGVEAPIIVVMSGAFHGRTLATLSATDSPNAQNGFGPLMPGFMTVPFNNTAALHCLEKEESAKNIVAVLIEPIQGESGVRIADLKYMKQLKELCQNNGWLLMLDEVQSGIGRTGMWFAHQHYGVKPDVITIAKALGNGFPIGACLASGKAGDLFTPGSHGSTFGGNPLGCVVANAVLDVIETKQLLIRAHELGHFILTALKESLLNIPEILEIRGRGLMIGVEFKFPVNRLQEYAFSQEKLLVNIARDKTLRILPPLTMTDDEASELVVRVVRSIRGYLQDISLATLAEKKQA